MRVLSPVTRSLWNLGRRGFKHLRGKINNENSVELSRFEIPKHRHCTTGFPPYCWSSQLKPHSVRNFCKQACPSWSYDRHMSIMFDWSSHSRAPFTGERRFSKSRGLSASVSFLPLPHPLFLILALAPILRGQNTVPVPFLGLSLLPNPRKHLLCRLGHQNNNFFCQTKEKKGSFVQLAQLLIIGN